MTGKDKMFSNSISCDELAHALRKFLLQHLHTLRASETFPRLGMEIRSLRFSEMTDLMEVDSNNLCQASMMVVSCVV